MIRLLGAPVRETVHSRKHNLVQLEFSVSSTSVRTYLSKMEPPIIEPHKITGHLNISDLLKGTQEVYVRARYITPVFLLEGLCINVWPILFIVVMAKSLFLNPWWSKVKFNFLRWIPLAVAYGCRTRLLHGHRVNERERGKRIGNLITLWRKDAVWLRIGFL